MFFVSSTLIRCAGRLVCHSLVKRSFCILALSLALVFASVLSAEEEFSPYSTDIFRDDLLWAPDEDDIEEDIEDDIEEDIEDDIEEDIEDDIEEDIEDDIEEDIEDDIEEDIEDDIEEDIEDDIEEDFEDDIEEDIEDDIEEDFDEHLDEDFDEELDEELEEDFDEELDDEHEEDFDELDEHLDRAFEKGIAMDDETFADGYDAVLEAQIEALEQQAVNAVDEFGNEMWTNGWLVFADHAQQNQLQSMGYQVLKREELTAIGQTLVTVLAPASFSLQADSEIIREQLDSLVVMADANHIYSYQQQSSIKYATPKASAYQPAKLINHIYQSDKQHKITIGMLDTAIAKDHVALKSAMENGHIVQKAFVGKGKEEPTGHGTQIAGILMGESNDYQGLIQDGRLLAASVFFKQDNHGDIATTRALLNGLNWLAQQKVSVINMSLTGPPNKLLAFTIEQLCRQGTVIVAAVGNDGPLSEPLFPAGYPCTIAVTAVDFQQNIYRQAVIGDHVDLASFGVDIKTLDHNGGYVAANGTSLATAFVSAHLAYLAVFGQGSQQDHLQQLFRQCVDLGEQGHDSVYGRGLLLPKNNL